MTVRMILALVGLISSGSCAAQGHPAEAGLALVVAGVWFCLALYRK